MIAVQHNVQQNNIQHNKINHAVSHERIQSMYNNRNEIAMDNDTITINNDEQECDYVRNEGETTIVSEVDDTDIGQV